MLGNMEQHSLTGILESGDQLFLEHFSGLFCYNDVMINHNTLEKLPIDSELTNLITMTVSSDELEIPTDTRVILPILICIVHLFLQQQQVLLNSRQSTSQL